MQIKQGLGPSGPQKIQGSPNAMKAMMGPQQKQMPQLGMSGGMMPGNRMGQMMGRGLGPQMNNRFGPQVQMNRNVMPSQELPMSPIPQGNTQGEEVARGIGDGQMQSLAPENNMMNQGGMSPSAHGMAQMFGRQRLPQVRGY